MSSAGARTQTQVCPPSSFFKLLPYVGGPVQSVFERLKIWRWYVNRVTNSFQFTWDFLGFSIKSPVSWTNRDSGHPIYQYFFQRGRTKITTVIADDCVNVPCFPGLKHLPFPPLPGNCCFPTLLLGFRSKSISSVNSPVPSVSTGNPYNTS